MALFDSLKSLLKREPYQRTANPKDAANSANARLAELTARFHACMDPKEKDAIFKQLTKTLHASVFLAAFCYADDNPNAKIRDRELHMTGSAKLLYPSNAPAINVGNPGFAPATKDAKKEMHLRTFINNKTGEVWVPLYTDFGKLIAAFGSETRVTVISFDEARKIAKPYKGLIINPGPQAIGLNFSDMKNR